MYKIRCHIQCRLFICLSFIFISSAVFGIGFPSTDILFEYDDVVMRAAIGNTQWVHQDRRGFLWIATNGGLIQYDGVEYKIYRSELIDPTLFGGVTEDSFGHIWVATPVGVTRLDPVSGETLSFYHDPDDDGSPATKYIHWVFGDKNGSLWLGTDNGLDRFDFETESFVHYPFDAGNPEGPASSQVSKIIGDGEGGLWIGYNGGEMYIDNFDPITGIFEHHLPAPEAMTGSLTTRISILATRGDGRLLIGTFDRGLLVYDPESGRTERYAHDDEDPDSILDGRISAIHVDRMDHVWVATYSGLTLFHESDGRFERFPVGSDTPGALSEYSDGIRGIVEDPSGSLLFVDWFGINRTTVNEYSFSSMRTGTWHQETVHG